MWLKGWAAIVEYTGIPLPTLYRYRARHGLPVGKLPSGRVASSEALLDRWLLESAAEYERRAAERFRAAESGGMEGEEPSPD